MDSTLRYIWYSYPVIMETPAQKAGPCISAEYDPVFDSRIYDQPGSRTADRTKASGLQRICSEPERQDLSWRIHRIRSDRLCFPVLSGAEMDRQVHETRTFQKDIALHPPLSAVYCRYRPFHSH